MSVKILVAYTKEGRVIGKGNSLPWRRLDGDLPRFKQLTVGNTVVMGRKTWESIGSKPLPNRKNVVVTRNPELLSLEGDVSFVSSLEEAVNFPGTIFVIGGEQIYREALEKDLVDTILATEVEQEFEGDAYFPAIDSLRWEYEGCEWCNGYDFSTYRRVRS